MLNSIVLLQSQSGGFTSAPTLLMLLLMVLVFWLFMIRPQSKKAKEQKKFIDNLQKGDKIVTTAGIHATVSKINEDGTLQIEVNPGSYLKVEKSAVSLELTKPPTATAK